MPRLSYSSLNEKGRSPRGAGRSFESIYKRNRMTMKAILFV